LQSKADEYRAKAQGCKESAASARDPEIKKQFEELAQQWWAMAQQIEQQRSR
jgi:hypothetical protein